MWCDALEEVLHVNALEDNELVKPAPGFKNQLVT